MVGTATDIDDQKKAEDLLRSSEERFRLAAVAVNGIIYDHDARTGRVERSRGLFEILGYRPEEVSPTVEWWRNQMHPDDRARSLAEDRTYSLGVDHFTSEYRVRHRDGHYVYLLDRAVVTRNAEGEVVRRVGWAQDVTDRKRAEVVLRRQATIFENQTDAIIITDLEGRILDWNPACEQMLGYTKAEVLGQTTAMFHRPEEADRLTRDVLAAMERDGVWRGDIAFVRKDGTQGVWRPSSNPLLMRLGRWWARWE